MRITNTMMTNNILMNINRNRETLSNYETQLSTGKKIQRPSDDPIVAVRALKFRTNVNEIEQYIGNAEDGISWSSVTEQAVANVTDIAERIRELSVQASSDVMNYENRKNTVTEVNELMEQFLAEMNTSYAGRHVFGGYKTNVPLTFTEDSTAHYQLTEHFSADDIDTVQRISNDEIIDVTRIRLGYDHVINPDSTNLVAAGFNPITVMNSTDAGAFEPAAGDVYFLEDTGELIFNEADIASIPDPLDFTYEKNEFKKMDLVPDQYFDGTNLDTGSTFVLNEEKMMYQISYSQTIQVNTMGYDVVGVDLQRDIEELVNFAGNIENDESLDSALKEDVLGEMFSKLIGQMDDHMDKISETRSQIGGRISRLELTINRLEEDDLNFTDLLSNNEDVDFAEVYTKMASMETVYNASLSASSKIIQPTLLDFIR